MLTALVLATPTIDVSGSLYRSYSAPCAAVRAEARPWPVRDTGTGGLPFWNLVQTDIGYSKTSFVTPRPEAVEAPFADLMQVVKTGFGRTMSSLPEVFGVSRQTLYNWLNGETPKQVYQDRIRELAMAAMLFHELGFAPTTQALARVLAEGKSFLQLVADGADGKASAKKLVRLMQRGNASRAQLDALLGSRRTELSAQDIGVPTLDEEV